MDGFQIVVLYDQHMESLFGSASESSIFTGLHVLLIEDNPTNRRVALELLKLSGIMVDIAENGLEAIELIKTNLYDAVFMDIQMPGETGLELLEKLKKLIILIKILIIYLILLKNYLYMENLTNQ